jgi:hypothetical protein
MLGIEDIMDGLIFPGVTVLLTLWSGLLSLSFETATMGQ